MYLKPLNKILSSMPLFPCNESYKLSCMSMGMYISCRTGLLRSIYNKSGWSRDWTAPRCSKTHQPALKEDSQHKITFIHLQPLEIHAPNPSFTTKHTFRRDSCCNVLEKKQPKDISGCRILIVYIITRQISLYFMNLRQVFMSLGQ